MYLPRSLVTYSCRIGDEDVDRTCKVNATNSTGCTALHYACWRGHQKVAETLKKAMADSNAKCVCGEYTLSIHSTQFHKL